MTKINQKYRIQEFMLSRGMTRKKLIKETFRVSDTYIENLMKPFIDLFHLIFTIIEENHQMNNIYIDQKMTENYTQVNFR